MARILENRFPIDSVERKALAFGFPLNGPAVFVPTYTTREQTKANLIVITHDHRIQPFFQNSITL